MRDDPGLDAGKIGDCLGARYGIRVDSVRFLPLGHDMNAFVYEVGAVDGVAYFLKIRLGAIYEPALLVPRALIEAGVERVLAPLPTLESELWCPLDGYEGYNVVLYPFVRGENAKVIGLSDGQWQVFGETLRAVHDSGLSGRFRDQIRVETFALPSAALVRQIQGLVEGTEFTGAAASGLAAFWRAKADRINGVLERAEGLGRSLQAKAFDPVLCHSDIHAANILVGEDERIWLVDWDGPIVAPRERDLLFVVGSRIARVVEPRDEQVFFAGDGAVVIDPEALIYYRYERIVEDLGEFGKSVFLDPSLSERARQGEAELAMSFFVPDGDIERAERVVRA